MTGDPTEIDAIEQDLTRTRRRLDETLGALQQRLSPGDMVDQAITYFKEGGGMELTEKLGRSVRENPIPFAMIGVGVGWLVVAGTRRSEPDWDEMADTRYGNGTGYRPYAYGAATSGTPARHTMPYQAAAYDDLAIKATEAGRRVERRVDETEDAFAERVHTAKGAVLGITRNVGEAAASFRERVEAALASAAEQVRRVADQAQDAVSDVGSGAAHLAGDIAERGQAGLRNLYDYGQQAAHSVRHRADHAAARTRQLGSRTANYLQEQPLLLGALGVALGAGLGLLLPTSRYEREVIRDVRRGLRDEAEEAVHEVKFRAARVAETVLDTARDASRREGLTEMSPSGLAASAREQVADTAGRVRGVVEETAAAGREALRRELTDAESRARTAPDDNGMRSASNGVRSPAHGTTGANPTQDDQRRFVG